MRNDFGSDYLMHHGILGQKWGIRRYQNDDGSLTEAGKKRYGAENVKSISSAKGLQRRLNDVDTAIARNKRDLQDNVFKGTKLAAKAEKMSKKKSGIEDEKVKQLKSKSDEAFKKSKEAEKRINEGEKQINHLINTTQKSGYLMSSKEIMRDVSDGEDLAKSLLLTAAATMLLGPFGVSAVMTSHTMAEGTQYKVKERKR